MTNHLVEAIKRDVSPTQREPLRSDQVENSAGGFVWAVDEWTHLRRFLILGSEGGTFYIGQKDLTKQGLKTIEKCLSLDGKRVVDTIVEVSDGGVAPKNDYALFALAVAAAKGDESTRKYALASLNLVARIGTHLFQFCEYLNQFGSLTGRAKRRALANWYVDRTPKQVAYQAVKYRQRNGWTHRDVLRLAHPARRVSSGNPVVNVSEDHAAIFDWISGRKTDGVFPNELQIIPGFENAQRAASKADLVKIIEDYKIPREAIPTEYLTDKDVWEALLEDMPLTALIRNLANMTRTGLLTATSDATQKIIGRLTDEVYLRKSRIHPINVLIALKTYTNGVGFRGSNTWTPVQTIADAMDEAFYKTFQNVEPTGKRILIGLDVSGSMSQQVFGLPIMCSEISAAFSLVTANVETRYEIMGFESGIRDLGISPRMRLDTVLKKISGLTFGGTDCSLPMRYAQSKALEFDAFIVLTDNETWFGNVHPAKALQDYRKAFGINDAKLVVVGMTATNFSIADPDDPGMLDVVGFDTSAPQLISNFIAGKI